MDARQCDTTSIPRQLHCLICCVLSGRAVDNAIDAPTVCVLQNLLKCEFRLESCLSADAQCQFAAMFNRFDCPNSANLGSAKGSNCHQADRAGTYDGDIFVCPN